MIWLRLSLAAGLMLALGAAALSAQSDAVELARQANQAYEREDYASAVALYEQVIGAGIRDPVIYFNLGNTYYALNELGWAMLNYRRAQVFIPRDEQLGLQITRIRSERVDFQVEESSLFDRLASSTAGFISLVEQVWLTLAAWITWFALVTALLLRPAWRPVLRLPLAITGVFLLVLCAVLINRVAVEAWRPGAVIVDVSVPAMSGPGSDYLPLFRLYAAAEVRVLDTRDGWVRVLLPDGRQGWIPRSDAAVIR